MSKQKYPISNEFFPLNLFIAPTDLRAITLSQKMMGIPQFVWDDPDLHAESIMVPGFEGAEIEVLLMIPKAAEGPIPCLVDIHGGGFVFDAFSSHYRLAMAYAKGARCAVAFVRYRLAPDHPFPVPQEDCFAAAKCLYEVAGELDFDPERIGFCGDSAGGTLAVTTCMMLRDRNVQACPLFQLLIYPWLDDRSNSESFRRFTDTPMWNSSMSKAIGPIINPDPSATPLAYRSPAEAESFANMPPAYIEVAEFDSLHDDGVLYAQLLRDEGIEVEFHETYGTMHGFDAKLSAPTTQKMLAKRIAFMNRMFWGS